MPAEEPLSAQQRSKIRRLSEPRELAADEEGGELNIVPFLDIVMNVLMFVLATVTVTFITTIDVPPPRQSSRSVARPKDDQALQLTLLVLKDGIVVNGRDRTFASDCSSFGAPGKPILAWSETAERPGIKDRKWTEYGFKESTDTTGWGALRECMKTIKASNPDEKGVTLTTDGAMSYSTVIHVIDAIRAAPDACAKAQKPSGCAESVLFPDVTFGLLNGK